MVDDVRKRPCGGCIPCKVNKQRKWLARLLLEAAHYEDEVLFVTLTYNPENLPLCQNLDAEEKTLVGTLRKSDLQAFTRRIQRLKSTIRSRMNLSAKPVRYYAVGEYGTKSERPHYHLILFGLASQCEETIAKAWPGGFICLRPAESTNMRYTLKYTLKGLTKDPDALYGREPEFTVMSVRPPLGTGFLPKVAESMRRLNLDGVRVLSQYLGEVRINGEKFPLDRTMLMYLKRYLALEPHQEADMFPKIVYREPDDAKKKQAKDVHRKGYSLRDRQTLYPV